MPLHAELRFLREPAAEPATGSTGVSGTSGTYFVNNLTVPSGVTLTIGTGVTVQINNGQSITADSGTLNVTAANSLGWRSKTPPATSPEGIAVNGSKAPRPAHSGITSPHAGRRRHVSFSSVAAGGSPHRQAQPTFAWIWPHTYLANGSAPQQRRPDRQMRSTPPCPPRRIDVPLHGQQSALSSTVDVTRAGDSDSAASRRRRA